MRDGLLKMILSGQGHPDWAQHSPDQEKDMKGLICSLSVHEFIYALLWSSEELEAKEPLLSRAKK